MQIHNEPLKRRAIAQGQHYVERDTAARLGASGWLSRGTRCDQPNQ